MASYWYRTGTATLTQGSKVVTISGAQLASAGLSAGDMFTRDGGQWYEIERIDGSEVTLASPYAGESEAEAPYAVIRLTFLSTTNAQLAVRLANLLHDWQQRESQLREWHGGTLDGGPNGDGRYPLSDGLGNTHLVPCPAWFGRAGELAYDFEQELDRVLTARDQAVSARDAAVPAAQTAEQAAQATGEDRAAVAGMKQAAEAAATTATQQAGIATTKASEAAGSAQQAIDAAAAVGLPNPVIPDSFLRATPDGAGYKAVTAQQVAEVVGPLIRAASQDEAGIVQLADAATAQGLTDAERVLTPATLGVAMNAHVLGMGQTWQDVTSQRAWNTIYTNTTGRPIAVYIRTIHVVGEQANIHINIGGVILYGTEIGGFSGLGRGTSNFAIIPPGANYSAASDIELFQWVELR